MEEVRVKQVEVEVGMFRRHTFVTVMGYEEITADEVHGQQDKGLDEKSHAQEPGKMSAGIVVSAGNDVVASARHM